MFRKFIFFLVICVFSFQAISQICFKTPAINSQQLSKKFDCSLDTTKHKKKKNNDGLYFGINMGFYKANPYTAQYYNGLPNKVDTTINSYYNFNTIKQAFNGDSFSLAQPLPKMHYSPAILLGIYLKYSIKNSGIIMQFSFAKLTAKDVFTLRIYDPSNFSTEPVLKEESIWGSEQRATIDLGYSYTFNPKKICRPFIQFGGNLTNTKFIENNIKVEGNQYSIADYHDLYYKIEQGGVGFGVFAGGGLDLVFNNAISIMPTLNIYYTQAIMGTLTKSKLNYTFYITAILNGLL
jgi:hypothetical protein